MRPRPYSVLCIFIEISINRQIIPTHADAPTVRENGPQRPWISPVLFCAENTKQIRDMTKPRIDMAIEHSLSNLSRVGAPPMKVRGVSLMQEAQIETQKKEKAGNSSVISGRGVENQIMDTHISTGISVRRTS